MSAARMLGLMVVGSAAVIYFGARPAAPHEPAAAPPKPAPVEWLSPAAEAQLFDSGGGIGPLFDGLAPGGPAPTAEQRARIDAFAEANHVKIELEVEDGELASIHADVTYGGCCGYEGADVLALRLRRPVSEACCGCTKTWIDDWARVDDFGVRMRARVRVNRVAVRWERAIDMLDVVDRAEALLGEPTSAITSLPRDRWSELELHRYLVEEPYSYDTGEMYWDGDFARRDDLGLYATIEHGRVAEITFAGDREDDEEHTAAILAQLRARWGRPKTHDDHTWTWRTADREIEVELPGWPARVTMRRLEPRQAQR